MIQRRNRRFWLYFIFFYITSFIFFVYAQKAGLKDILKNDFYIGTALNYDQIIEKDSDAIDILKEHFNAITAENVMKWYAIHPEPGKYNFEPADSFVVLGEKYNMHIVGHVLVWHHQVPEWVFQDRSGNLTSRDTLLKRMKEHISTIVGRYKGRVHCWDVVNEAITDDGSLRETVWLRGIGPEYIDMAFQWAHEADPEARLFYNDFGGEGLGRKSDAIYQLVEGLLQRGAPIHGVGLQMHVALDWFPDPQDVSANMTRLDALGLQVHITEMDVQIQRGTGTREEKLNAQAGIYRNMLGVCLAADNCTAFVLWGFTDRHSWIPYFTGNPDAPLIFDESYYPKPAYHALREELIGG